MSTGQVRLERIYTKDISFESPNSPDVFRQQWKPEVQLDIHTSTSVVLEDRYEVVLTVTLKAKLPEDLTAFIVEVQQAGVFFVEGLEEAARRQAMATVCPNVLFPYVREAVDGLVVKGGFPAMHLAPVNFDALFAEAERRRLEQEAGDDTQH